MKISILHDVAGEFDKVDMGSLPKDTDLMVYSGSLTKNGTMPEFVEFLMWSNTPLGALRACEMVVGGRNDWVLAKDRVKARRVTEEFGLYPFFCQRHTMNLCGRVIFASPFTRKVPGEPDGAFSIDDKAMDDLIGKIPPLTSDLILMDNPNGNSAMRLSPFLAGARDDRQMNHVWSISSDPSSPNEGHRYIVETPFQGKNFRSVKAVARGGGKKFWLTMNINR